MRFSRQSGHVQRFNLLSWLEKGCLDNGSQSSAGLDIRRVRDHRSVHQDECLGNPAAKLIGMIGGSFVELGEHLCSHSVSPRAIVIFADRQIQSLFQRIKHLLGNQGFERPIRNRISMLRIAFARCLALVCPTVAKPHQ